MKSIILYSLPHGCPPNHAAFVPVQVSGLTPLWVRAEVVEGDVMKALDKATPRRGETVLNTVPFKEVQ